MLGAGSTHRLFEPRGLRSVGLVRYWQQVLFELINVWVRVRFRFALVEQLKQFLVHLSVFEVGIGVLCPHDILLKDALPVLYLPDLVVTLIQFLEQLLISGPCDKVAHLALKDRLPYLNAFGHFWIVKKLSLLHLKLLRGLVLFQAVVVRENSC